MDHEALVSLMNNPHPLGKLARWGLALQELDLTIHYRPGKLSADGSQKGKLDACKPRRIHPKVS